MKTIRLCYRIAMDAFYRFNADDGWAIASHIALSTLMSMFPFLILVTAIAGFIGSKNLADEVARLIIAAWPAEVSGGIAGEIHDVLTTARGDILTVGAVFALYFSSSGIESLRIGLNRAYGLNRIAAVVAVAAGIDRLCADRRARLAVAVIPGHPGRSYRA